VKEKKEKKGEKGSMWKDVKVHWDVVCKKNTKASEG
jgi:hypothetical protein